MKTKKVPPIDEKYIETRNAQVPVVMEMMNLDPDKQVPAEQSKLFFKLMDLQTQKVLLRQQIVTCTEKLSQINGTLEALA